MFNPLIVHNACRVHVTAAARRTMNKLKKKSRTLAYAEAEGPIYNGKLDIVTTERVSAGNQVAAICSTAHYAEETTHALTTATVYKNAKNGGEQVWQDWITRALNAEAMLSARDKEQALHLKQHLEREAILERLVHILLAIVAALIFALIYQANLHHLHDTKRNRWSSPAHFTIPILSPFTSVIEHETSVVSSRTIAVLICVAGCVLYLVLRYWISRR
ncbi:hypothetical protein F5887DRAFT_99261 [Amanita rubescens]|nr:hypothetical protein F5887DRAFT_99261 [Amanita rubescens]